MQTDPQRKMLTGTSTVDGRNTKQPPGMYKKPCK